MPFEDDDDYDLDKPLLVEDIRAGKGIVCVYTVYV